MPMSFDASTPSLPLMGLECVEDAIGGIKGDVYPLAYWNWERNEEMEKGRCAH